jgi:4-amino-4-deoxy-L-arabinose transferase-like glycosyltransferase
VDSRDSVTERAAEGVRVKPFWWEIAVALAIVIAGTLLRLSIAVRNAETPMIDENEVAEQAVAFLGPDLNFYFLKYGPLTMYAIAAIYRVAAALHGITPLEYASRVFLEGTEHYTIARVYTSSWLSVLALVAFFVLRRQLGVRAAWLACALLAFPLIDVLAFGARIDAPQAAFQCLALLALTEVVARPGWKAWVAAGACAGLGIATKPLPGLLLAPAFLLASWFASAERADGSRRALLERLGVTFGAPGLWIAALACVICAVAGNPELIQVQRFIDSQRQAVELHSGDALQARSSIPDTFLALRWPFVACAGATGSRGPGCRSPGC